MATAKRLTPVIIENKNVEDIEGHDRYPFEKLEIGQSFRERDLSKERYLRVKASRAKARTGRVFRVKLRRNKAGNPIEVIVGRIK